MKTNLKTKVLETTMAFCLIIGSVLLMTGLKISEDGYFVQWEDLIPVLNFPNIGMIGVFFLMFGFFALMFSIIE